MYQMKKLLDNRIKYVYHPVLGYFNEAIISLKKYGDAYYHLKQLTKNNEEIECFVGNNVGNMYYGFVSPTLIKDVLLNQHRYDKMILGTPIDQMLMQGLLMAPEDVWKKQRALLAQSFRFEELKQRF
jgi:cytochrome P450